MKKCSKCGETKKFNYFSKRRDSKDGYRSDCKTCRNKVQNIWALNNKEKVKASSKKWREANRELQRKLTKNWELNNPERRKKGCSDYRKRNLAKYSAYTANRTALKRNSIPYFLTKCEYEKDRITKTYKLCNLLSKSTGVKHHVDHMWPLSDGGPHWSGNLQIITATENVRKQAKVDPNIKATIQEMLIEEEQMLYGQH